MPGEWEPGCDLGNNEAHAKPYPPPRLTDEQLDELHRQAVATWLTRKEFARAIESAVRKQFGVNDE